ncbi:hypothetical protein AMTR_s00035p00078760, partial [Amborella trichopoda]
DEEERGQKSGGNRLQWLSMDSREGWRRFLWWCSRERERDDSSWLRMMEKKKGAWRDGKTEMAGRGGDWWRW